MELKGKAGYTAVERLPENMCITKECLIKMSIERKPVIKPGLRLKRLFDLTNYSLKSFPSIYPSPVHQSAYLNSGFFA